jgi:hypothetical protein
MSSIDLYTTAYRSLAQTFLSYVPNEDIKDALNKAVDTQIEITRASNKIFSAVMKNYAQSLAD